VYPSCNEAEGKVPGGWGGGGVVGGGGGGGWIGVCSADDFTAIGGKPTVYGRPGLFARLFPKKRVTRRGG